MVPLDECQGASIKRERIDLEEHRKWDGPGMSSRETGSLRHKFIWRKSFLEN